MIEPRRQDWVGAIDPDAEVKLYAATGVNIGILRVSIRGKLRPFRVNFFQMETVWGAGPAIVPPQGGN